MRQVAGPLREALGYEQGRTRARGKHPSEHLFAELAEQTHRDALEYAEGAGEVWLTFKDGISCWWTRAGDLAPGEFNRLYMLQGDVVKLLTNGA